VHRHAPPYFFAIRQNVDRDGSAPNKTRQEFLTQEFDKGWVDPLPTLDNALAVRDTVARLVADVYAGRIHPRIATSLAPLMSLQLRAIETANFEQRVADGGHFSEVYFSFTAP
jgi:hypothetical protein